MKYTPRSSEEELIQGCRKENRLAQKYLYQLYFGKMLGICMRYTKNKEEAIEVLNIAFYKVFKNLDKYQPTGPFGGWVARIVFNTSIDFIRKQATYKKTMDFNTYHESSIENEALGNLEIKELLDAIQQLTPSNRTVFSLYVIDGYKHHEIATKLNISEGTSKWHLATARKNLREILKNYYPKGARI